MKKPLSVFDKADKRLVLFHFRFCSSVFLLRPALPDSLTAYLYKLSADCSHAGKLRKSVLFCRPFFRYSNFRQYQRFSANPVFPINRSCINQPFVIFLECFRHKIGIFTALLPVLIPMVFCIRVTVMLSLFVLP